LLAIMLFYPPFFGGLYFENELLPTHMLTAVIFALFASYKLRRRELAFFEQPLDYAVFILLGLYVTSSIDAWSARDAITAVLKMADYCAVYWLLAHSVRSLTAVRGYLGVLLASGAGVSLLGLGAATGTFPYPDAFSAGRIYGSLQYPNSTAAFLMAINLCGLYLWDECRSRATGVLLAVANFLIWLTILGTQSRGVWLVYPVGLLIMLAGLRGGQRWRVLGYFGVQLAASLAVYSSFMASTGGGAQFQGWLLVLAGAVLASLIYLGWQYIAEALRQGKQVAGQRWKNWMAPAAVALAVIVLAGGCLAWRHQGENTASNAPAMPGSLVSRMESISAPGDTSLADRVTFSRDALRIMVDSPVNAILGTGGGGWNAAYHRFQSFLYFTAEVHDQFMQVGVETGFPGLLDFLAIWGLFIVAAWRLYHIKEPPALPSTAWVILSSGLALGLHSAMDLDLSLGAVAILLWGLFGLLRGLERLHGPSVSASSVSTAAFSPDGRRPGRRHEDRPASQSIPSGIKGAIIGALSLAVFFLALDLILGSRCAAAGDEAARANIEQAIGSYEQALRYDRWNTQYRSTLTRYILYLAQQDDQVLSKNTLDTAARNDRNVQLGRAQAVIGAAVRENRGDSDLHVLYAQVLASEGAVDESLQQLEQANALLPFDKGTYEDLAHNYFAAGLFSLQQAGRRDIPAPEARQRRQRGQDDLQLALGLPGRIQDRMAGLPVTVLKQWKTETYRYPLLVVTPTVSQAAGQAAVLLGRYQEADGYLQASLGDSGLRATSLLWEGISLQQQGETGQGRQLIDRATGSNPALAQELPGIETLLPDRNTR
jgi:tetratricopeptide (TPR) repeat protein/O-antigen ligase